MSTGIANIFSMEIKDLQEIKKNPEMMASILKQTAFLEEHYSGNIPLRQRLWHIDNHLDFARCKGCSTIVKWNEKGKCYRNYCSSKCAHNSYEVKNKTKSTNLERYGVTTTLLNESTKKKIAETNLKKLGVTNPFLSKEIQSQIKRTNLQKFGVDNPSKLPEVKEKITRTNYQRYHRKRFSQIDIPQDIYDQKNNRDLMLHWYQDLKMPISEIADRLGIGHSQLCIHFRDNLDIDISRHNVSQIERQIVEFVESLGYKVRTQDRELCKPKEIDIVIEDAKLAIEVNGLYWHTESKGKHKNYHLEKTLTLEQCGYQLLHILDSEWKFQQDTVKSRITAKLGCATRIYGRHTTIMEIDAVSTKQFLEQYHIQGHSPASANLGLFHNNELVAVMTFGTSRFSKKYQWELIRYATKHYTTIIGGPSKLFKFFVDSYSPLSIISYADRRWNTGNLYQQLGFRFSHFSGPGYYYTKDYVNLYSRNTFQKKNLKNKLEYYSEELSEWENMQGNGYDRFWDCGNSVWVYG